MGRPKSPSPDTRTRILAAASAEFGVHGFAATTVDRIARRARVNKAMIYYHFPTNAPSTPASFATSSRRLPNACARR
jgi:hypothetical protein